MICVLIDEFYGQYAGKWISNVERRLTYANFYAVVWSLLEFTQGCKILGFNKSVNGLH